jgi:hypothetical protein
MTIALENRERAVRPRAGVRRVNPCSAVQRDGVEARRVITRSNAHAWRLCDDGNEPIHPGATARGRVRTRPGGCFSHALARAAGAGSIIQLQQPGLWEHHHLGHTTDADPDLRASRRRSWSPGLHADGDSDGADSRAVDDNQRQLHQPAHFLPLGRRSVSRAYDGDVHGEQAQGGDGDILDNGNQRSRRRYSRPDKRHLAITGAPSRAARTHRAAMAALVVTAFAATPVIGYDWLQFNGDSAHTGNDAARGRPDDDQRRLQ